MEKSLIILRGLPGAGKSALAKVLGIKAVCCADDYFILPNGKYIWKAEKIGRAHEWCQRKCRRFMKKQIERIAVSNTCTTERELTPYLDLARQFGYKVFSVVVENRHGGQNDHNVPTITLDKMKERFEIKL
jgi:predicted kinase